MKKKIITVFLCSVMLVQNAYASILGTDITSWTHKIGDGAEFSKNEFMSEQSGVGKQTEYIAEYTPNANVVPNVVTGETVWGKRTITQAEQYMKNNGMTPLIGINASFFSFKTGVPMGHVLSNGEILSKDTSSYQSIGFMADGTAFISPLAIRTTMNFTKQDGTQYSVDIAHINKYNQTVTNVINLYTDDFDSNNHTEGASLNLILESNGQKPGIGKSITAVVEEKFNHVGSATIPDNKILLTLNENVNDELYAQLNALDVGDTVTISGDAAENNDKWSNAVSGLGSEGDVLVRGGEVQSGFAKGAAPRTAVGITDAGKIIFYVIDGRQTGHSYGVQLTTLAKRMKELGCVEAINLDGGGSTAISGVYPGSDEYSVLNSPSEGTLRSCTNYIFLQNMREPTGIAGEIFLYPFEQHYLSGYSEQIYPATADTAGYKTENPTGIEFFTEGSDSTIDKNTGVLTAKGDGTFKVGAVAGEVGGSANYHVYSTPTNINVYDASTNSEVSALNMKKGDSVKLYATAQYGYIGLKASNNCFNYEVSNDLGYVNENYELICQKSGTGTLKVIAGGCVKEIPLTVETEYSFADISNHWAAEMIEELATDGIVNGYQTDFGIYFMPDNNISRQEFAAVMCRFSGIDVSQYAGYETEFADKESIADWAKPCVAAMASMGIINGKQNGSKTEFAPEATLTRAEAITILGRVIGGEEESMQDFADSDEIPEWARKYVSIMTAGGFVSGYDDNTIKPNKNVTRAEAVTMLYKILNKN